MAAMAHFARWYTQEKWWFSDLQSLKYFRGQIRTNLQKYPQLYPHDIPITPHFFNDPPRTSCRWANRASTPSNLAEMGRRSEGKMGDGVDWLINYIYIKIMIDWLIDWLFDWLIGWLIDLYIWFDWLIWSIWLIWFVCLFDWFDWLIDWLIDWSIDWLWIFIDN